MLNQPLLSRKDLQDLQKMKSQEAKMVAIQVLNSCLNEIADQYESGVLNNLEDVNQSTESHLHQFKIHAQYMIETSQSDRRLHEYDITLMEGVLQSVAYGYFRALTDKK